MLKLVQRTHIHAYCTYGYIQYAILCRTGSYSNIAPPMEVLCYIIEGNILVPSCSAPCRFLNRRFLCHDLRVEGQRRQGRADVLYHLTSRGQASLEGVYERANPRSFTGQLKQSQMGKTFQNLRKLVFRQPFCKYTVLSCSMTTYTFLYLFRRSTLPTQTFGSKSGNLLEQLL